MEIKIKPGMRFRSKHWREDDKYNEFVVIGYDYFGALDVKHTTLRAMFKGFTLPLDVMGLDAYMPKVDGRWVEEKCEYVYE